MFIFSLPGDSPGRATADRWRDWDVWEETVQSEEVCGAADTPCPAGVTRHTDTGQWRQRPGTEEAEIGGKTVSQGQEQGKGEGWGRGIGAI